MLLLLLDEGAGFCARRCSSWATFRDSICSGVGPLYTGAGGAAALLTILIPGLLLAVLLLVVLVVVPGTLVVPDLAPAAAVLPFPPSCAAVLRRTFMPAVCQACQAPAAAQGEREQLQTGCWH